MILSLFLISCFLKFNFLQNSIYQLWSTCRYLYISPFGAYSRIRQTRFSSQKQPNSLQTRRIKRLYNHVLLSPARLGVHLGGNLSMPQNLFRFGKKCMIKILRAIDGLSKNQRNIIKVSSIISKFAFKCLTSRKGSRKKFVENKRILYLLTRKLKFLWIFFKYSFESFYAGTQA